MALINRPGFSTSTEVEASSFSVWNCVITFLQILLVSTLLYGPGFSTAPVYDVTPENLIRFEHFRAVAFFFCVWALQSVALALLLVWAIGKRSYHLCHSWVLCETLMQVFIVLSAGYFAYRCYLENDYYRSSQIDNSVMSTSTVSTSRPRDSIRPPKHLAFLIILHFLIKSFGFWIVCRYMKLLKATHTDTGSTGATVAGRSTDSRYTTPPPSYTYCKDDPPCYEDALKMGPSHSSINIDNSTAPNQTDDGKNVNVPV